MWRKQISGDKSSRRLRRSRPRMEELEVRQVLSDAEPNNSPATASPTGIKGDAAGEYSGSGTLTVRTLDGITDGIDYYSLAAPAGAKIAVDFQRSEIHPYTRIAVYLNDASNNTIAIGNNVGSSAHLQLTATAPRNSVYFVVAEVTYDLSFIPLRVSYELSVTTSGDASVFPPPPPPPPLLPDLALGLVTTTDANSVTVDYSISNANIEQPITFSVYRSTQPQIDRTSTLIGESLIATSELTIGPHEIRLLPGVKLPPDPFAPFVIVVANQKMNASETSYANNTSYFKKHLLGMVVHGFQAGGLFGGGAPEWIFQMSNYLFANYGYSAVQPFDWARGSGTPYPGQTAIAGERLYNDILQNSAFLVGLSNHEGDVVDIHLIGHSRGTVVISQALQSLTRTSVSYLNGSYIKITLLDPHPANNSHGLFYSSHPSVGAIARKAYLAFQAAASDPQIVLPESQEGFPSIKNIEIYYQHTPYSAFHPVKRSSSYQLNIWGQGEGDGIIINRTKTPIRWKNLTSVIDPSIGVIGHSDVHQWYRRNVLERGHAFLSDYE